MPDVPQDPQAGTRPASTSFLGTPFRDLFGRRKALFAVLVVGSSLLVVASMVPSFAMATLVDSAFRQRSVARLGLVLLALATVHVIEAIVDNRWRHAMKALCDENTRTLSDELINTMSCAPLATLEQKPAATVYNRLRTIPRVVTFYVHWYVLIVSRPLFFGVALCWLFVESALLGAVILTITVAYVRLYWSASSKLRADYLHDTQRTESKSRALHEFTQGLVTLRIAQRLVDFYKMIDAVSNVEDEQTGSATGRLLLQLTQTFSSLAFICVLGLGAYLVIRRELSIGHLIVVNVVFRRVLGEARFVIERIRSYYRARTSAEFVGRFIDELRRQASRVAGVPVFERLELHAIGLQHARSGAPSLQEVDLTLRRGEFLALVGGSGSGKTSLLKTIAGLYTPTSGSVEYVGTQDRQQAVAYMSTSDLIFSGTVAQNISLHGPMPFDDVVAAARCAQAHGFLSRLHNGYETRLGPAGAGLSQGQKTRIAIARCLASGAPFLLMDEPTGTLDPDNENSFLANLREWRGDRTLVMATHRPAPALEADQVAVMRNGRLVERGAPAELLANPDSEFSAWCRTSGVEGASPTFERSRAAEIEL